MCVCCPPHSTSGVVPILALFLSSGLLPKRCNLASVDQGARTHDLTIESPNGVRSFYSAQSRDFSIVYHKGFYTGRTNTHTHGSASGSRCENREFDPRSDPPPAHATCNAGRSFVNAKILSAHYKKNVSVPNSKLKFVLTKQAVKSPSSGP